jgi:DNA-directed RNA polymerase subunit D
MKIINEKKNQITFSAEIEESLANAIRRYIYQIPVIAIDEVEISKNDSPLYDETVAHRIGLIPLKMNKSVKENSEVKLKLSVKKEGMVYSKELIGKIEPVYGEIPITSLKKGGELDIVAIVKSGKGSTHSKFSPGLMFYRDIIDIKIEKDCPPEVVNICPQRILKSSNGKIIAEDSYKCDMCEACTDLCQKKQKDSITLTPLKELTITLESFGQLDVKDILNKSINVLKKDLSLVSGKIAKIK